MAQIDIRRKVSLFLSWVFTETFPLQLILAVSLVSHYQVNGLRLECGFSPCLPPPAYQHSFGNLLRWKLLFKVGSGSTGHCFTERWQHQTDRRSVIYITLHPRGLANCYAWPILTSHGRKWTKTPGKETALWSLRHLKAFPQDSENEVGFQE